MPCPRFPGLIPLLAVFAGGLAAQPQWDLLVRNGHLIDPKNGIDGVGDVAISGGKVARVGTGLPTAGAKTVVDATGLMLHPD